MLTEADGSCTSKHLKGHRVGEGWHNVWPTEFVFVCLYNTSALEHPPLNHMILKEKKQDDTARMCARGGESNKKQK